MKALIEFVGKDIIVSSSDFLNVPQEAIKTFTKTLKTIGGS
jgi:hypothetical protein